MEAAIPAVALVAGFLLALFSEWVRDGRAVRRERKLRSAEAQRQNLIDLQEAFQQLGRAAGSLNTARRRRYEDRREWLNSEDFLVHYETLVEARIPILTLASRIDDATLRDLIAQLREEEVILVAAPNPEEAIEAQTRMAETMISAIERAGELIRSGESGSNRSASGRRSRRTDRPGEG